MMRKGICRKTYGLPSLSSTTPGGYFLPVAPPVCATGSALACVAVLASCLSCSSNDMAARDNLERVRSNGQRKQGERKS